MDSVSRSHSSGSDLPSQLLIRRLQDGQPIAAGGKLLGSEGA
jgi:hypothetical protein